MATNERERINSCTKRTCWETFLKNLIIPTTLPWFGHEKPDADIRNVLLVATALIAAVTFQAGVTPPGGVWQDDDEGRVPGRSIFSSRKVSYYFSLTCNTLTFWSSTFLLLSLTFGYPFLLEVLVATFAMAGTYAAAIFRFTPDETGNFRLISLVAAVPFVLRILICFVSCMVNKFLKHKKINKAQVDAMRNCTLLLPPLVLVTYGTDCYMLAEALLSIFFLD
ncbi:hypothetical protein I3760_06G009500 [Carya illinoinensis]|nr:hypothetical protein I3760_06G009500 [Carya illinoinensis]